MNTLSHIRSLTGSRAPAAPTPETSALEQRRLRLLREDRPHATVTPANEAGGDPLDRVAVLGDK